jgi:hypothetical protein
MCLDTVSQQWPDGTDEFTEGWKLFYQDKDGLYGIYYPLIYDNSPAPLNEWITAKQIPIPSNTDSYVSGFHVFRTEADAEIYRAVFPAPSPGPTTDDPEVIKRVLIRKVTARGLQLANDNPLEVLVARELLIPQE